MFGTCFKGAPNQANAMKFLAFAAEPEQRAKLAKLSAMAPTNGLALPRGAKLINISRGAHVVEADLLAALDNGQIGGDADGGKHPARPPG
jgi:hypothetical protein